MALIFMQATPSLASAPNNPQFISCVNSAANAAIAQGADRQKAMAAIEAVNGPDPEIIATSRIQPESNLAIWDYLAPVLDDERVQDGAAAYLSQKDFLAQLGVNTGVDPATIAAVWGVETNFGKILGKRNVISALATLGCTNNRRASYFRSELVAAIRIQAAGHVSPNNFIGSWAGAFGQTQFMPSSFWRLAVDGNNDGIKNIISEPKDALASTANFLLRAGWRRGETWGYEVIVPNGYSGTQGRTNVRSLNQWSAVNIRRADGKPIPISAAPYGLIFPGGRNGPAFLVGRNFNAVYAYNPATSYALAVNLLADKLKGGEGVIGKWPAREVALSRAGRREIQMILANAGYDIGPIDGIIGAKAKAAISDMYRKKGFVWDGRPTPSCLNDLKIWTRD